MRFDTTEFEIHGPPGDKYFQEFERAGSYGDDVTSWLRENVQSRWCCLDIGANIGLTSLYLTAVGSDVEVFAFEPSPNAFRYLQKNIERNRSRLRGGQVTPVQLALMDRKGTAAFADLPTFVAGSHVLETSATHPYAVGLAPIQVECMTLDDYVDSRPWRRLDLIKVDVEGCEEKVLRGATRTLARFSPLVLFEFNGWFLKELQNDQRAQLLDALMTRFARVFVLDRSSPNVRQIENSEAGRKEFIEANEKTVVDNLLCVPAGREDFVPPGWH